MIIGPTAVSAPKYYAFISSGQLKGMLGGMKGAAEYEQLLAKHYPDAGGALRGTRLFTATKGMDAQTGHPSGDHPLHPDRKRRVPPAPRAGVEGSVLMVDPIGTWLAALLTLAVLSFLYRDNPVFRFAESLFAGVSLGYYVGIVLDQTLKPNLFEPLRDNFSQNCDLMIAGVLGALLYMRYVPRIGWVARYGLAVYVAITSEWSSRGRCTERCCRRWGARSSR